MLRIDSLGLSPSSAIPQNPIGLESLEEVWRNSTHGIRHATLLLRFPNYLLYEVVHLELQVRIHE